MTQQLLFDDLPHVPPPGWPFGDLLPGSFDLIMCDPPWRFIPRSAKGVTKKGAAGHYRTMTLDEIKALPVGRLGADDCVLWLWATAPMYRQALEVVDAWGFKYSTMGWWAKRTKTGKLRWGTGYRLRSTGEPYIIATRGGPKSTRGISAHIDGLARENSRKPEESFAWAEKMMPNARRLELFSRCERPGWSAFGDEVGKFTVAA